MVIDNIYRGFTLLVWHPVKHFTQMISFNPPITTLQNRCCYYSVLPMKKLKYRGPHRLPPGAVLLTLTHHHSISVTSPMRQVLAPLYRQGH